MDCSRFEELIELYLDGELKETAEFEAHMKSCENCRDSFNFSKQIRNTIKDLPPIAPPADFVSRVNEKLDAEIKSERIIHMPLFRIPSKYYGMAACVLLAVILGINNYNVLEKPQLESEVIEKTPESTEVAEYTEPVITEAPIPAPVATDAPVVEKKAESTPVTAPKAAVKATSNPTVTPTISTTTAPTTKPTVKPTSNPTVIPTVKPAEKTKAEVLKEQLDNSSYSGRVVLAWAAENEVAINEDSVVQAEKDISYRRDYSILQEATATGAIATDATLGSMTNVKVVVDNSTPPTGAFGDSIIVYKRDADKLNGILNKYTKRPMGEFFVMTEEDYKNFTDELKANGINYTDSGSNKSRTQDVMFKLVIA